MEKRTPIALFAYNRPNHVRQALQALEACRRLDECRVIVFCDGPRNTRDVEPVVETRAVVSHWTKTWRAEVIEREENLGLARSIVTGVSDLCREHGRVIVLEDDLVVSPDFIDYMLGGLDRYEARPEVYQVSGYSLVEKPASNSEAYFIPLTTTWGWATWERAWKMFKWEPDDALTSLSKPDLRHRFNLDGIYNYANMLEDRLAGRNDSWGILWWWAVFQAGGLVLYPPCSLVCNCGFDATGVHCGDGSGLCQPPLDEFRRPRLEGTLEYPPSPVADLNTLALVKAALEQALIKEGAMPPNRRFTGIRHVFRRIFSRPGARTE